MIEQIGILGMSLEASLLILAVVVIRSLALHHLPKSTFIALWGVAAARLLIPLKIPSSLSVYSLLGQLTGGSSTVMVTESARSIMPPGDAAAQAVSGFSPPSPAMLWAIGFALCAAFFVISYVRCTRRFACSLPVESAFISRWLGTHKTLRRVSVRRSDAVSSPLTYGVLKPVILLPSDTDFDGSARLTYILAHEHVHIRRFDAAAKLMLALVVSIHWFNPAVWVMYILANRDLELRSDECAVRSLGEDAKSLYALALIGMVEKKSGLMPLCSGFCKTAAEERIVSIMKIKKASAWSAALALALVTSTCAVFATSAKAPDQTKFAKIVMSEEASSALVRTDEKTAKLEMSIDGGKTWDNLNASDPDSVSKSFDIVWWTADEYAKWLEQEKKDLQGLVGTGSGYYGNGVYYEWTQKHVDETIAMYEDILKDIKNGVKHSKTVDGKDDVTIGMKSNYTSVKLKGNTSADKYSIAATEIKDSASVAEGKNSAPLTRFTKLTASKNDSDTGKIKTVSEREDSIRATKIILKATELEAQDSVPLTKFTKLTPSAKKSK